MELSRTIGFGLLVTTTSALLQIDLPRVTGANLAINQTVAWSQPIGQMTLTEVDARSSLGIMNSGVGIKVGDVAKPISSSP